MQAGDYGVTLTVETGADLSAATAQALRIARPDGSLLEVEATVAAPATDGRLEYLTQPDDFPREMPGMYRYQAVVMFGENQELRSEERDLIIGPGL